MPGFLAVIGRFLAGGRFILRGKEGSLPSRIPSLLQLPEQKCRDSRCNGCSVLYIQAVHGAVHGWYTYQAYREGIYQEGYTHQGTRKGIYTTVIRVSEGLDGHIHPVIRVSEELDGPHTHLQRERGRHEAHRASFSPSYEGIMQGEEPPASLGLRGNHAGKRVLPPPRVNNVVKRRLRAWESLPASWVIIPVSLLVLCRPALPGEV